MLYDLYQFIHRTLNMHFWDLPALIVLVLLILVALGHYANQKKRQKEFDDAREEKIAANAQPSTFESIE